MSLAVFSDYTKRIVTGDVPFLGVMTWFSVSEASSVSHLDLQALLPTVGLEHLIPDFPKDWNVFRQTCSAAQRKRVATTDPDVFENYLVRDVKSIGRCVWKHLVVETVDKANRVLGYEPVFELAYNYGETDPALLVTATPLGGNPSQTAQDIADSIVGTFYRLRARVNAYGIRELIRRTLAEAKAVSVRENGGVYFVMADRSDMVTALEALATQIEGMRIHSLPLIDDQRQREMIKAAIEAESVGECDKLIQEILDLRDGPEISEKRFADVAARVQAITEKADAYGSLLDEALGNTEFRRDQLQLQVQSLLNHVKLS